MKIPSLINMRLILHHWDTDGICSAALLYNEESKNMTPIIGNYFLTDDEIERISQFDEIYIADLALHEDSLKKLVEVARVKVFDHHLTKKIDGVEYINPIMNGKEEEEYPSASWIVGEFLEKENILSFLGAVGDWEERIKQTKFYSKLQKFMKKEGISFKEMLEMVSLLDSNYKMGNKKEVEKAVSMLWKADDIANFILNNRKWRENKRKIEEEIIKAIDEEEIIIRGIRIKEIDCPYNIISTVARRLWNGKEYVIVVNKGYFEKECQVYVRGENVAHLIKMAHQLGYIAGGKKNVMGAIVPKQECNEFIEKILEVIK